MTPQHITDDLKTKAAQDVTAAVLRTVELVRPDSDAALEIAVGAAVAALAVVCAWQGYTDDPDELKPVDVFLAALTVARSVGGGDAEGAAWADIDALSDAGRMPAAPYPETA